jgi:hypothetical protein
MADLLFTDRSLQDQYRALMRRNTEGHLDEATWDRLTGQAVPADERATLFDHIVTCEHCSTIWRGVLALRTEAETHGLIAPDVVARSSSWLRSPMIGAAIAATLVLAVGGIYLSQRAPVEPAGTRGNAAPPVEGLMMAYNAEGVPNFVWTPQSDATRYRVEVFSEDGRPIWTREVTVPIVQWPADVPRAKGAYRWRVDAMSGADMIARSRLTVLELSR